MAVVRRGLVLGLGLPLALACLLVWLAPTLIVRFALPRLAARAGGSIEVSGVWPAYPFGVGVRHLRVAREGRELALDELRAVLLPSGPRLDARIGDGTLLVRGEGLWARTGIVRVQNVALESLATVIAAPVSVRGRADGVWRFGSAASVEGSVSRGAFSLSHPAPFEIPFEELVVSAARAPDTGAWNLRWADIQGPPLSASASGAIGADGTLALSADVRQLEEPVRAFFAALRLPTDPLPVRIALAGTLAQPRLAAQVPAAATGAGGGR